MRDRIVPDLALTRALTTPELTAFCTLDVNDAWQSITWRDYATRVDQIAQALHREGLARGDRVAILAPTSLDWDCTQLACLSLGAAVVGIDPNYAAAQRDAILRMFALRMLFVANDAAAAQLPDDVVRGSTRVIALAPPAPASPAPASPAPVSPAPVSPAPVSPASASPASVSPAQDGTRPRVTSLTELLAAPATLDESPTAARPDDEALIVLSSGTTGTPKPIAYTHRQVLAAVDAILAAFPDIREGSRLLCWLPLANLFQRIVNFCGIERGATSYIISDPREVMRHVARAKPHLLIGVPRFFEKLHDGISERIAQSPRIRSRIARWALATGTAHARRAHGARRRSIFARPATRLADRLVLARLRQSFGGNLRYFVSGSAPMPIWLLEWYAGIGVPVLEAYGVSENIVPIALNRPGDSRMGTVGKPVPGQDVRLAADGEILVRGPGVFGGYLSVARAGADSHATPPVAPAGADSHATPPVAAARNPRADGSNSPPGPDAEGYWATGDFGAFDDGFLRVTGRKSDSFKLATGRWMSPVDVEAALRRIPYVDHAVVVGAGRRTVVAVLTVTSSRTDDALIARDIDRALAGIAVALRPAGVVVTGAPFSIEGGELTANLKLRRATVEQKYAAAFAAVDAALATRPATPGSHTGPPPPVLLVRWP